MAADGMTDISEPSMKRLDALYQQAENWIPTRFKEYEEKGREQYFFVKK